MQNPSGSVGRILCTEDDQDSREMMVLVLQQAGYEVDYSDSPSHTLELAREGSFDLIVVDNWMPEMNGDELTKEIRTFNQSTPILFYSGAGYESDRESAIAAGAQGYLIKPQGIADLVTEIGKLIHQAKSASP